jgi:hypothetical protein
VASISSSVVFPDPFGPTNAVTEPGGASKDISSTATTEENVRRTERTDTPPVMLICAALFPALGVDSSSTSLPRCCCPDGVAVR